MNERYIALFNELEHSKKALLESLSKHSHEELSIQKNGKWSVLQNSYHLHLAEEISLKYVVKKLSFNPELKNAGISHYFRLLILQLIEIVPVKLKAPPAIAEDMFPADLTLEMVEKAWNQGRVELRDFFENIDDKYLGKEIYKQPSAGRLTLSGMLQFFLFHFDRHKGHIDKILIK